MCIRDRVMIAAVERTIERTSGVNKIWRIMAGIGVLMVALNAARVVADPHDLSAWLLLGTWVPLTGLYAGLGRLQRRQFGLLRRSVRLNSHLTTDEAY